MTAAVDVPVLAGSTTNDTWHSIELTAAATVCGVSGILAVTPYYNRPSQEGSKGTFVRSLRRRHFRSFSTTFRSARDARSQPRRSSRSREVDNIVGLKDAAGDPSATFRLLREAPSDFECYIGDDLLTLPLLAVGAVGLIGVATHWCGVECGEMIRSFKAGDVAGGAAIGRGLIPSFTYETGDDAPNPQPLKAMLRAMGLPAGDCRAAARTDAVVRRRACEDRPFRTRHVAVCAGNSWLSPFGSRFSVVSGEIGRNCAVIEQDGRRSFVTAG